MIKLTEVGNNMYFGNMIKNIREMCGYSLIDVQKRTGIKESQLCRIELGTRFPTNEQIYILAKLYDTSQQDLIIQRDSDKLLASIRKLNFQDEVLDATKEKLKSKDNYLSTIAGKLKGAAIALESRRYIGCKAKLSDWIFEIINNETSNVETAADIFAGTGVIAKKMLEKYDRVIINDFLYSNNIIYNAFFKKGFWNKEKILNKIGYYNSLDESILPDNYFSINYGGKFFDYEMSKKIGWIREDIELCKEELTEKEFYILLAILIYSIDKHANTLGHFEAYIKKPIKKTKLRLQMIDVKDYDNALIYRCDANELVKKIDSDLVYIDPPYNSRQYCRFYHIYETLVKWDKPVLSGVALKPPIENSSKYCTSKALETFNDLVQNIRARYLVVSYNNTYNSKSSSSINKIQLNDIKSVLEKKGKTKIFSKDYRCFQAGRTDLDNHKELLFVTKVN